MAIKQTIYNHLPSVLQPVAKRSYQKMVHGSTDEGFHSQFIDSLFDSPSEYTQYADEFNQGPVANLRNEAFHEYQKLTQRNTLSGVGLDVARDYYAVTRKLKPNCVIETGVCNGISTLSILLALRQNGEGQLYSIDFPLRADESLEEFREETFEGYGGAAIPSDKDPGWIIPEELKSQWELTIGKSQRELPRLVAELETFDMFIHDSEHSHPCMMFEYELAYEWLENKGVILSDDISWNDAFSVFTDVREPEYGRLSCHVGYIRKSE